MPDRFNYSPNLSSLSSGGLKLQEYRRTTWRNGSASDSRSEGCVFESRRGQITFLLKYIFKACTGQMGITRKTL